MLKLKKDIADLKNDLKNFQFVSRRFIFKLSGKIDGRKDRNLHRTLLAVYMYML